MIDTDWDENRLTLIYEVCMTQLLPVYRRFYLFMFLIGFCHLIKGSSCCRGDRLILVYIRVRVHALRHTHSAVVFILLFGGATTTALHQIRLFGPINSVWLLACFISTAGNTTILMLSLIIFSKFKN